jgi:hypothetical protein
MSHYFVKLAFILICNQVVHTVTTLVDLLPEDVFVEQVPSTPPSMFSTQASTDSIALEPSFSSQPLSGREAARNNIIRELVETERKYVQDLEVMQVSIPNALFVRQLHSPSRGILRRSRKVIP